jgi:hypothetical protein
MIVFSIESLIHSPTLFQRRLSCQMETNVKKMLNSPIEWFEVAILDVFFPSLVQPQIKKH